MSNVAGRNGNGMEAGSVVRNLVSSRAMPMVPPAAANSSDPAASGFSISDDRKLQVAGSPAALLTEVPNNVMLAGCKRSAGSQTFGAFLGFDAGAGGASGRHLVALGKLKGIRFMSLFRFKIWWTTPRFGSRASELQNETQMLLLDTGERYQQYVVVYPIIEGPFRAALEGSNDDHLMVCAESGSTRVTTSSLRRCVYLHAGAGSPFRLVEEATRSLQLHLGTFRLRRDKPVPELILDRFGWCTWDAFYLKVSPTGIFDGLRGLAAGKTPAGFLLIDDGWQSVARDGQPASEDATELVRSGEQMPCRLTDIREGPKFRSYQSSSSSSCLPLSGLAGLIRDLKSEMKELKAVLVWHALCGYWSGIRPNTMTYEAKVEQLVLSPGAKRTMQDLAVDMMVNSGIGLVEPLHRIKDFFQEFHSRLAACGVDGVKVDVIQAVEFLGEHHQGRVKLAKVFYDALSSSISKNFSTNAVVGSMEQCNDFMLLGTHEISLARAGDDFWLAGPSHDPDEDTDWLQGLHIVYCAFNGLWMGPIVHLDWDMFQSTHPSADFHAAARAISGGPTYVSDCPGQHNFEVLRKIALMDGTQLRCCHHALPTRDVLFSSPVLDGSTMLKVWNLNKWGGLIGAFNCQGGGWDPVARENRPRTELYGPVLGSVSPKDVEWEEASFLGCANAQDFAVYMHQADELRKVGRHGEIDITLQHLSFELFHIVPISRVTPELEFAPLGLANMYNTGGAVQDLRSDSGGFVRVEVRGSGRFIAFASRRPTTCKLDGDVTLFTYTSSDGRLLMDIPWTGKNSLVDIQL